MRDPVVDPEWRHTHAPDRPLHECRPFIPDPTDDGLLFYDPASESGETYAYAGRPVDLREWA